MALPLASLWSRGLGNSENGLRRQEFAWVCKSSQTYVSTRDFHTNDAAAFYKLIRLGDYWKKIVTFILRLAWENKTKLCTEAHGSTPRMVSTLRMRTTISHSRHFATLPSVSRKWRLRNEHRNSVLMTRHYQEVKLAMSKGYHLSIEGMVYEKVKGWTSGQNLSVLTLSSGRYISWIPLTPSTNELLKDGTSGT